MKPFATLALALLFAACPHSSPTGVESGEGHLLGDVNLDGEVNIIDVQQLHRWVNGYEVAYPIGEEICGVPAY